MVSQSLKGALIASAVAGLFAANPAIAKDADSKQPTKVVKCGGINSCKGKGACAGAENACKSMNSCKGKGYIEVKTEKECKDKGGTVQG